MAHLFHYVVLLSSFSICALYSEFFVATTLPASHHLEHSSRDVPVRAARSVPAHAQRCPRQGGRVTVYVPVFCDICDNAQYPHAGFDFEKSGWYLLLRSFYHTYTYM